MKAIICQKDQGTFALTDLPVPEICNDFDVLVKVFAVGLNPVDYKLGEFIPGMGDDFVPGLDVSGEIVGVGSAVKGWNVGDKVLYHGNMFRTRGGFAEYAIQDSRTLIAHPNTSSELAAATPCAAWTAWRSLVDKLNIGTRESIFIAGGAGGVGSFAIQIARHFGVKTIITSASAGKHDYVRQLGATHAIDYRNEDVIQKVLEITGDAGVEASFDCVGGENDLICASVLGFEGHMAEIVKLVEPANYPDVFMKGLSFHQLALGAGHDNGPKAWSDMVKAGKAVSALLESEELSVPMLEVISLEQVPEKLMAMSAQRTTGKIVASLV